MAGARSITGAKKPGAPKATGKTTALKEIDKKIKQIIELFDTLQQKD